MNYIEQINMFWLLDIEHLFNGNETRLYFFLLKQSNSLYWKNPLTNADDYTAATVGISVNTMKTCRNRLQQAGLIIFKTGGNGRRDKCVYQIVDAERVNKRYQKLTPNPQPNLEPNPQPFSKKTDDISKLKGKRKINSKSHLPQGGTPEEKNLYWKKFIETFDEFYLQKIGSKYMYLGKDMACLNKIYKFLQARAAEKNKEWNEVYMVESFRYFLNAAYDKDKWIKENFSIPNILSQINQIANGNSKTPAQSNAANHGKSTGAIKLAHELAGEIGITGQ
jgi:hypothetical protein